MEQGHISRYTDIWIMVLTKHALQLDFVPVEPCSDQHCGEHVQGERKRIISDKQVLREVEYLSQASFSLQDEGTQY